MADPAAAFDWYEVLKQWSNPAAIIGIGAVVWRVARGKVAAGLEHLQLRHDHDELKTSHEKLAEKVTAVREAIATLATKDDLMKLGDRVADRVDANFGHLVNLLKKEHQ
jgi:glucose-6-phosphate isomerase